MMVKTYRLKRLRMGLSQWKLAALTGIAQSRISLFENKLIKLKDEEMNKLREALGLRDY